ncbi:MAG: hypothetical protein ACC642_04360 [Pseudomonadales bacterium]
MLDQDRMARSRQFQAEQRRRVGRITNGELRRLGHESALPLADGRSAANT